MVTTGKRDETSKKSRTCRRDRTNNIKVMRSMILKLNSSTEGIYIYKNKKI